MDNTNNSPDGDNAEPGTVNVDDSEIVKKAKGGTKEAPTPLPAKRKFMTKKRMLESPTSAGSGIVVKEDKSAAFRKPSSSQKFKTASNTAVKGVITYNGPVLHKDSDVRRRDGYTESIPRKNSKGVLEFADAPDFCPNMTPKEVLQAGSFGGTYFRPITSSVTGATYDKMWNELPQNWLDNLTIASHVASSVYDKDVNMYKVKCGGSLEMWETSGWIVKADPYGWFQWYCRYYLGRRTEDDSRQISRWKNCAGTKGRWKNNLIGKIARAGVAYDNAGMSPVVRQVLQHWGYKLTEADYKEGKKRVKM